jgi:azurin
VSAVLAGVRERFSLHLYTMSHIRPASFAILLATLTFAPAAWAQAPARTVEVTAGDDMKYSVATINAKPGEKLRIRLKAVGAMPKVAMAHNVVILKIGTDQQAFATAAASARATNFVPPAMKDQVIAASGLAGNGETVDLDFVVPKVPGKYPFICTFPGHFLTMKGTLVVGK